MTKPSLSARRRHTRPETVAISAYLSQNGFTSVGPVADGRAPSRLARGRPELRSSIPDAEARRSGS